MLRSLHSPVFLLCSPVALFTMLAAVACSSPAAVPQGRAGESFLQECTLPGVNGRVLCGTLPLAENRAQPGRRIPLNVVVLKATGSRPRPDAFLPLAGGPGQAATPLAAMEARVLADVRRDRDVVLIDIRGTGKSNPLACDVASPAWARSADLLPPEAIRACRDASQQRADLRMYTTVEIARDLDEVRQAMGIATWNVFGASYGSRLAQEYARAFGAHVRTLTLHGVAAPSMAIPLTYARDAQRAADAVLDRNTQVQLTTVLAALRKEPVVVPTGAGEVMVSAGAFADALRHLLYNAGSAPRAVEVVRAAASGDFTYAADEIMRHRRTFSGEIALGLFLSVTCAEDIPRITESAIADATRDTFLGDYRVRQQQEACRQWSFGTAPPEAATPLKSPVPALLISGEVDPVTPPRMGDEVARTLPNATHVVIGGHGHTLSIGEPCMRAALEKFLDTASARELDLSCVQPQRTRATEEHRPQENTEEHRR